MRRAGAAAVLLAWGCSAAHGRDPHDEIATRQREAARHALVVEAPPPAAASGRTFDAEEAEFELSHASNRAARCRGAAKDNTRPDTVRGRLIVNAEGAVERVVLDESIAGTELGACMVKALSRVRFPGGRPEPRSLTWSVALAAEHRAPTLTGIPECDDFVDRYERCLRSMGPEVAGNALDAVRRMYADMAARARDNPEQLSQLANSCRQTRGVLAAMKSSGCEW